MKKAIFLAQGVTQIFVGLTSFVSGALMIAFPSGSIFQAPPDMLRGSPFHNFLIPGIILLAVNGIGQLIAAFLCFRRHPLSGYLGAAFGIGLIIWIFVQVDMIGGGSILQYGYFALGVAETALAVLMQPFVSAEPSSR